MFALESLSHYVHHAWCYNFVYRIMGVRGGCAMDGGASAFTFNARVWEWVSSIGADDYEVFRKILLFRMRTVISLSTHAWKKHSRT